MPMIDPQPARVHALLRGVEFSIGLWTLRGQEERRSAYHLAIRRGEGVPVGYIDINAKADNPPRMIVMDDAFEQPGFAVFARLCMSLVKGILDDLYDADGSDYAAVRHFVVLPDEARLRDE